MITVIGIVIWWLVPSPPPARHEVIAPAPARIEVSRHAPEPPTPTLVPICEVEATAYTYTGNHTCTGDDPTPNYTVAVDPKLIPIGTELYVVSDYPGITGYYLAMDTGGDIQGRRIDLFMESHDACVKFGRRDVKIYMVVMPRG